MANQPEEMTLPATADMTEREMLIEIVERMRLVAEVLSAIGNSNDPMTRMLGGMMGLNGKR